MQGKYELKDMTGNVFFNDVGPNDRKPAAEITFKFKGEVYRVAGWKKETRDGRLFWSFSIEEGERQRPSAKPEPRQQEWKNDLSDEIPF